MEIPLYFKPSDITIFAVIKRLGSQHILIGLDGRNLVAFPGGKVEPSHASLLDALEDELVDEIGATINPNNFGNPAYNLNCVLAHHTPLIFFTVTNRLTEDQKLIRNPLKFHQEQQAKIAKGIKVDPYDIKVRVVVPMYETTGNKPKVKEELTKLAFTRLTHKSSRKLREMVKITLKKTMDGRWNNLPMPNLIWPWHLNLKFIHNEWTKAGMDPDMIHKYAPVAARPARFQTHTATRVKLECVSI